MLPPRFFIAIVLLFTLFNPSGTACHLPLQGRLERPAAIASPARGGGANAPEGYNYLIEQTLVSKQRPKTATQKSSLTASIISPWPMYSTISKYIKFIKKFSSWPGRLSKGSVGSLLSVTGFDGNVFSMTNSSRCVL